MDEELISKKELLQITGISYGQLYRWKRKSLIPEEWFIRKSAFTGQETFFPREKIMERINKIMNMKDDVSLDDLAEQFSHRPVELSIAKEFVIEHNIVTKQLVAIYEGTYGERKSFCFEEILHMYMVEKYLSSGDISFEEGKLMLTTLQDNYEKFQDRDYEVIVIRKYGIGLCLIVAATSEIYIEAGSKLLLKTAKSTFNEELKAKLLSIKENIT